MCVEPDPCVTKDPRSDSDEDGDVDHVDFGAFQKCLDPQGLFSLSPECSCFDRDINGVSDGFINADDFETFMNCALTSGPGIPADPNCDGVELPDACSPVPWRSPFERDGRAAGAVAAPGALGRGDTSL